MAWVAAAAALLGSLLQSDASQGNAATAAGADALKKQQGLGAGGFTPTAEKFAAAAPMPATLPDSLDRSPGAPPPSAPPPLTGPPQQAGMKLSDLGFGNQSDAAFSTTAPAKKPDETSANDYAKTAISLVNALRSQQGAGGGLLPQGGNYQYQPTALTLQQLLAQQQGGGGNRFF